MNNLTLEKMQEHAHKLTIDHIKQGADGYAQYALNHPLKDFVPTIINLNNQSYPIFSFV